MVPGVETKQYHFDPGAISEDGVVFFPNTLQCGTIFQNGSTVELFWLHFFFLSELSKTSPKMWRKSADYPPHPHRFHQLVVNGSYHVNRDQAT